MTANRQLIDPYDLTIHLAKKNAKHPLQYDDVLAVIADEKRVDAVEVVHERWVHKGAWHIECSECQHILAHIGEAKNYCPYCGAKMDKEES